MNIFDITIPEIIQIFQESCPELFMKNKLAEIKQFYCPVSIAEADVKEYIIEEYDSLELLVLQLYDTGLRNESMISSVTGFDDRFIKDILHTEMYTYGHIDIETGDLSETGRKTLEENENSENDKKIQHAIYNVKREIQIEAITGTVIKSTYELQKEYHKKVVRNNDKSEIKSILPKEVVSIDNELSKEIHERLEEYKDRDYLNDGDTIKDINNIHTKDILFRKAVMCKFEGLLHPLIVFESWEWDKGTKKKYFMPTALSESNAMELKKQGINTDRYLVRKDKHFEYLLQQIELMSKTDDELEAEDDAVAV